ncbi:MFS transporter [Pyxidicoccus fallax]|uniref:MFS transporter n=1 Tax=Pyxidicoccus fallax TaxID=394095 RepID=A0A848LGF7_9BACT|nr:MFS transporter [Pyxidicoccus fallax]NMO15691.1 MFS transporter [Pyxidicoccus fallax]NPC77098.1 MFS transporter [Pyxidicoccus fallax]
MPSDAPSAGAWAPLRHPPFRALWLAVLASNVGTWVQDVAASWFMSERTSSPLMVAAVQSATTLPVVAFALVAGTLADIVDRRRYLLVAQLWMLFMATMVALQAHAGRLEAWSLLCLTFALGTGAAMAMPAQAATTADLVPRPMLAPAVALSSIGVNIARSLGPALGGLVVARFGAAWAFSLNALSFLAVVFVLWRWKPAKSVSTLPVESFGGALRAGLRYALQAGEFRSVLIKSACFFVFASALPALMPIVVRQELSAGAGTYGLLLGFIGAGAIGGAIALPKLRERFDADTLVPAATLIYACSMLVLAGIRDVRLLCVAMLANGASWLTVLSSLQTAAHVSVPAWVRARALSLYIVVFSAGMAGGSLIWGTVAQQAGTGIALTVAAILAVLAGVFSLRFRLSAAMARDNTPSAHWARPAVAEGIDHARGPVLVTVEYLIEPADREEFLHHLHQLGGTRRRDGAVQWGVMEDAAQPGRFLEYFIVDSWLEHLRQHERVTHEEQRLQDRIRALHRDAQPPSVRHFVGATPSSPHAVVLENVS